MPKEMEGGASNRHPYTHVHSSRSHNSQEVEASQCPQVDVLLCVVVFYVTAWEKLQPEMRVAEEL
jgi:hypothetical protein